MHLPFLPEGLALGLFVCCEAMSLLSVGDGRNGKGDLKTNVEHYLNRALGGGGGGGGAKPAINIHSVVIHRLHY